MSKERGGGLVFLAAGIYGLAFSIPLPLGRWNQPGPGVFPLGLSILLCIFGVSWLMHGGQKEQRQETADLRPMARQLLRPLTIVVLTAGFILALGPLGYPLSAMLYIFVLLRWVSRCTLWVSAVLAAAIGTGSWLFFERLLSTPLPRGFFP